MIGQSLGVIDTGGQTAKVGVLIRNEDTRYLKGNAVGGDVLCIVEILTEKDALLCGDGHGAYILVDCVVGVPGELVADKVIVVELGLVDRGVVVLGVVDCTVCDLLIGGLCGVLVDKVVELCLAEDTETGKKEVGDLLILREDDHYLVIVIGNLAVDIVLRLDVVGVVRSLLKVGSKLGNVAGIRLVLGLLEHRGVDCGKCGNRDFGGHLVTVFVKVGEVNVNRVVKVKTVVEGHRTVILLRHRLYIVDIVTVDVILDEEVCGHLGHRCNVLDKRVDVDLVLLGKLALFLCILHHIADDAEVIGGLVNLDGVARKHIVLHCGNIALDTRGERKNKCDTDDTDGASDADHCGTALL